MAKINSQEDIDILNKLRYEIVPVDHQLVDPNTGTMYDVYKGNEWKFSINEADAFQYIRLSKAIKYIKKRL